jgi:hypothetical protein
MIRDQLSFVDGVHERGVHDGTSLAQGGDLRARKNALVGESFRGQEFNLEHRVEAMFVAEEISHVLG